MTTDMQLEIKEGRLQVSNLNLQTTVREFDVSVAYDYSADFDVN